MRDSCNVRSYVACRMPPFSVTFSDIDGHVCCLKPLSHITPEIQLEANILMTLSHLPRSFSTASLADVIFCPFDSMLARYWLSLRVCLSVCLSVTSRSCTKAATHWIMQTTLPRDFVVLWYNWYYEIPIESPPMGARNAGGVDKHCVLRPVQKSPSQSLYRQKFVSIRYGGPSPLLCTGGRIHGVINI